jgi:hypothetical protein
MNIINVINGCLKFNGLYCGQHMDCEPNLTPP